MSRLTEITDISRHLDQQISELLLAKMKLLATCGHTPVVGSAVALASAQNLTRVAIGMWLSQVPEPRRPELFEETIEKLVFDVRKGAPSLLESLRRADGLRK